MSRYNLKNALIRIAIPVLYLLIMCNLSRQYLDPNWDDNDFSEYPQNFSVLNESKYLQAIMDMDIKASEINATAPHTATLVFLHDHGECGKWWMKEIAKVQLPYMKILFPTAQVMEITSKDEFMTSWYNFSGTLFLPHWKRTADRIDRGNIVLHHYIKEEISNGIPPERIIIFGIGQGATMAIHTALTFGKKLGGIITLAGWHPIDKDFTMPLLDVHKDIPVFHVITDLNEATSEYNQKIMLKYLEEVSNNVVNKSYIANNSLIPEEVEDIKNFLRKHIGPITLNKTLPITHNTTTLPPL